MGEEVPFSFSIIFGENKLDLVNNARFAQVMYNSHYQSYTPPAAPNVTAIADHQKITLSWDDAAENSIDAVTGYADFEGYKVYKSNDGGKTWGNPEDIIYDDNGIQVGWKPIAQFDLSASEDSLFCVFSPDTPFSIGLCFSAMLTLHKALTISMLMVSSNKVNIEKDSRLYS